MSREKIMRALQGGEGERTRVLLFFGAVLVVLLALCLARWSWKQLAGAETRMLSTEVSIDPILETATPAVVQVGQEPLPVLAVVVENSTDARPQSGVERAFTVYEVPVEGTITRWLALFDARESAEVVEEIGPVRSARPALLDLAAPWEPLFVHVGGSPEALEKIGRLERLKNWDEFFHAGSFWRSKKREAPHNVYTATDRLLRALRGNDEQAPVPIWDVPRRVFSEVATKGVPFDPVLPNRVHVRFGHASYDVDWTWDGGSYLRSQQGVPSRMASGIQISASTVVIVKTSVATIDEVGRKRITLTGTGDAIFCTGGRCIDAEWKKASSTEPLLFVDTVTGERLVEAPGVLWVEVVDRMQNK